MESFDGAVLICDITGFTQLTEQLSKQGPSGVEQLTKCMNNYFTKVSLPALRHPCLSMTVKLHGRLQQMHSSLASLQDEGGTCSAFFLGRKAPLYSV